MYIYRDWAGFKATRRSTSEAMVFHWIHLVCFANRLQVVVASSFGDAELNAYVVGLCEGLGAATVCGERGMPSGVERLSESSAARGIASRIEFGKSKHLQVERLWARDIVKSWRNHW